MTISLADLGDHLGVDPGDIAVLVEQLGQLGDDEITTELTSILNPTGERS